MKNQALLLPNHAGSDSLNTSSEKHVEKKIARIFIILF